MSDLCGAYYGPVFAFIRRSAPTEEAARDLTQAFFARILAGHGIDNVDPDRGRFRSFLLGAVKHFLSEMRQRAGAAKRGSGETPVILDAGTDTTPGFEVADANAPAPDLEFDRKWALTLLDRALAKLANEHEADGKRQQFETIKPWLTGDSDDISQASAAATLGVNEGAVKVAIHRLRRRFRELVKLEIGQTLRDPSQVGDELACLQSALAGR